MKPLELKSYIETGVPWIAASGLVAEVLEPRHVRLRLPRSGHLNHIGSVYAGSQFMLLEISGAALFGCTYSLGEYVPINAEMRISFVRMATTDITCELAIPETQAIEMIAPVDRTGRGSWTIQTEARDARGRVVSTAECQYLVKRISRPLRPRR